MSEDHRLMIVRDRLNPEGRSRFDAYYRAIKTNLLAIDKVALEGAHDPIINPVAVPKK